MENPENIYTEKSEVKRTRKTNPGCVILLILVFIIGYFLIGFYSIQPIGAIPDGVTLVIFRAGTQLQFFDSADAMCERTMGGVSLLCRGMAISAIVENDVPILVRLPYIHQFYLFSTGGFEYNQ